MSEPLSVRLLRRFRDERAWLGPEDEALLAELQHLERDHADALRDKDAEIHMAVLRGQERKP